MPIRGRDRCHEIGAVGRLGWLCGAGPRVRRGLRVCFRGRDRSHGIGAVARLGWLCGAGLSIRGGLMVCFRGRGYCHGWRGGQAVVGAVLTANRPARPFGHYFLGASDDLR